MKAETIKKMDGQKRVSPLSLGGGAAGGMGWDKMNISVVVSQG